MAVVMSLADEVFQRLGGEDLSKNLFSVGEPSQHVRHVQGELVDRDLTLTHLGGVRSLSVASPPRKILLV